MDINFIKETVFKAVDFSYDGEIEFFDFDGVKVEYNGKKARIGAKSKNTFARGLFLLAMNIADGRKRVNIEEKKHFDDLIFFLDCSRNGVMRVSSVKKYIEIIASLGFDGLMLYTEDTYEIEGRPRFGYLRGRYSKEEIQEMVAYGEKLGIELMPCIQTLGHLEQYIKWSNSGGPDYTNEKIGLIRDTEKVLLCEEEETYKFIEDEIKACRAAYKTKTIHIGMDEADGLGRGRYLAKYGLQNRFEIMQKHLKRVVEICEKYGFKPMIWSDMYFRLGTGGYYRWNFDFPEGLKESMPDVDIVYWDYYADNSDRYDNMIKKHYELADEISFAGAIATWYGFLPPHDYSYLNSVTALKSCLKHNVKRVILTTWGDDGNETNAFLARPLLSVYSEYCYKGESCTKDDIKKASEFLTKISFSDARLMGNFNFVTVNPYLVEWRAKNGGGVDLLIGKRLFYSDILYDMSVRYDSCDEIIANYKKSAAKMAELYEKNDKNKEDYRYAYLLYRIGGKKAEIVKKLRKAYKEGNKAYLEKVCRMELPQLKAWYEEFVSVHKKQWLKDYKPFGYEVLNFRFGGVMARVDYAIATIENYLNGNIEKIEELEEEILVNEETNCVEASTLVTPSSIL